MKYNRTKNATRNIFFNLITRIYNLAVPFLIRTIFIYVMGVQYMGLNSLFISILSVLSLAELGVGGAMVYAMYKPLAEDDNETVCALMQLYKIYYRIIGLVVLIIGLSLTPFLPYFVKDELPADVNLYVLYFLNLASTVVTYWLFAYKNCIIGANQRADINSKINLIITSIMYFSQIAVLLIFHNYYLYIIISIITSILSNITTAIIANRMFPQFQAKGTLPKETVRTINRSVRDLFTSKLGLVIINSADTIVISTFLGFTFLTQYNNYYYIMTSVSGFLAVISTSLTSIIGNSIVSETKEKNYHDFKILLFIISWLAGFCTVCLLCLYQPFMKIWMGEELMLDFGMVVCFCIYFFVYEINKIFNLYKDASGMWHSDRWRPLVLSILNLGLNLASVKFLGLYGIILSTIIPMVVVGYSWLINNLCHEIFQPRNIKEIFIKLFGYFLITATVSAATYLICSFVNFESVWALLVKGAICAVIPNILFILIYRRTKDFQNTLDFVEQRFLKGRFNKAINFLALGKKS